MSLDINGLHDGFIRQYLQALDCPRSLAVWLLYESKEHDQLVGVGFDPHHYNDIGKARDSLAATKFLSKARFLTTSVDLKAVALEKFFVSEQVCKKTNSKIYRSQFDELETPTIISYATRKIDKILGSVIPDEFVDACDFGPGATTAIRRRDASKPKKFLTESKITREAYEFVAPWFKFAFPTWEVEFDIDGASKIVTVPKDSKGDRTIAIEPGINLFFQKGIGTMIRTRLRRSGIDLNHQDHNQEKSRLCSRYGDFATVDFSSASDTISKAVVSTLLPSRWLSLMEAFRSSFGRLSGSKDLIFFEKFSSMGNGFTFELESLIFYSIAFACCEYIGVSDKGLSVFGDDVIIPASIVDIYYRVVSDLGFTVNKEKSYSTSYYRESCGSHYWNGVDIKPIFLKEKLDGKTEILKVANSVRRYAHRRNYYGCDRVLRSSWKLLTRSLGNCPLISEGYGDVGLIENIYHPDVTYRVPKYGHEGYIVRVWTVLALQRELDHHGLLLSKLRLIGGSYRCYSDIILDAEGIGNNVPLVGRTKPVRSNMLISEWYDLGPWI